MEDVLCYKTNKKHTFLLPSWSQLRDETLKRHGDQYVSFITEGQMEDSALKQVKWACQFFTSELDLSTQAQAVMDNSAPLPHPVADSTLESTICEEKGRKE